MGTNAIVNANKALWEKGDFTRVASFTFSSPNRGPAEFIECFRKFYGPTMNAFDAAEKNGKTEDLHGRLQELAHSENTHANGGTSIAATFMRVTVNL